MKLIDGKELARSLRGEIAAGVAALKSEKGITPGLAVILVGDNPPFNISLSFIVFFRFSILIFITYFLQKSK